MLLEAVPNPTVVESFQQTLTGLDFSQISQITLAAIGATAAVVITLIAIRKGWGSVRKAIKGA